MVREKKVVLFLVEGPTDEVALVSPMRALLKGRVATESLAFYCDVTTVCLFPSEAFISREAGRLRNSARFCSRSY